MISPETVTGGFLIFSPGEQWTSGTDGIITVSTFSAKGASGTFSFTAVAFPSGATKSVTEGVFDLTF
jgi:hypothetical protein